MAPVGTVSLNDSSSRMQEASFDVSTPEARAKLLFSLKGHASEFTPEEHKTYDAFRDALLRMARGEVAADTLAHYAHELGRFLGVPSVMIGTKEEAQSAQKIEVDVPDVVTHPAEETLVDFSVNPTPAPVPAETVATVPPVSASFSRGRMGPDIHAPVVAEPALVPVAEPLPPAVEAPEAPSPSPAMTDVVTSPSPEISPVEEFGVLADSVEDINDALNAFAHGTAFKWLSDASTGYRTYLNELLLLRSAFVEAKTKIGEHTSSAELESLRVRVDHLRSTADSVRDAVGVPRTVERSRYDGAEEVHTAPPDPQEGSAKISNAPEPVSEPTMLEPQVSIPEKVEPETGFLIVNKEAKVTPAEVVPNSAPLPTNPMEVPGTTEIEEVPEEFALNAVVPPHSELSQVLGATPSDPLSSREVNTGLHDLLVHWLGSTGFLGFGDSGEKHPDWLVMRSLYVDDVLAGDGVIPQGIRPEIYANLAENIRAWKRTYSLMDADGESVEHFIRRVVEASMVIKPS